MNSRRSFAYWGGERAPAPGGKGVRPGPLRQLWQQASDDSNIRLLLSFPLSPLSRKKRAPAQMGDEPGPRG